MKILLLLICITLASCTTEQRPIIYTSKWTNEYAFAILHKCNVEANMLAFYNVDYNYMTNARAEGVKRFLLDSCVKYYNITI
ncbi:MAG: hypothetical protein ACRC6V_01505 [Bacteroidales bacterium]